jgi:hypothetical protein
VNIWVCGWEMGAWLVTIPPWALCDFEPLGGTGSGMLVPDSFYIHSRVVLDSYEMFGNLWGVCFVPRFGFGFEKWDLDRWHFHHEHFVILSRWVVLVVVCRSLIASIFTLELFLTHMRCLVTSGGCVLCQGWGLWLRNGSLIGDISTMSTLWFWAVGWC